jgi:hypothetical protein
MIKRQFSTFAFGIVGVAAVGILSIVLLGIIIVGAPSDRYDLTSYELPPAASPR